MVRVGNDASRLSVTVAFLVALVFSGAGWASAADSPRPESHCVRAVIGQLPDGQLILGTERCYDSFMAAALDISDGVVELNPSATGEVLFTDSRAASLLGSFTLGTHFDGANGSGSSISIVGSNCSGGWWNTGGSWANRISSSQNGCYRLTHHDYPNRSGASQSTLGSGTHNLSSFMNNKTESVSYWSS